MVQVVVPNYIAAGKSNLSRYSPAQNVTCRLGMHEDHGREGAPARLLPLSPTYLDVRDLPT